MTQTAQMGCSAAAEPNPLAPRQGERPAFREAKVVTPERKIEELR